MKRLGAVLIVLALWLGREGTARGFIDPSFTPVDLVQQSEVILLLEFADPSEEGTGVGAVKEVVKGDYSGESVKVEFLAMGEALAASGKEAMGWIAGGRRQAMLLVGSFTREGGGGERAGYLHLAGKWLVLSEFEGNWDMQKTDPRLLGCWAGSTDMLLRCVRYILSDENAAVPVSAGALWQAGAKFGHLKGSICSVDAVDLAGTGGRTDLFCAAAEGDRLYRFDGAGMTDVTDKHGLTSKSQAFTWAEFTGDGRLDLLSWDGKSLSLHAQRADGTFEARPLAGGEEALKGGCLSLAAIGAQGGTKVVASVAGPPLVLTIGAADGPISATSLAGPDYPGMALGAPGACLAADFDADARPDVLQLFSGGSLFYRGKGEADFGEPVVSQAAAGEGRYSACVGDYDADGLPDVFVGGARRHYLFHNLGDGRFANLLDQSGEIEYIPKPGAVRVQTGDVNNDGRQDILVVYGAQMGPQLFFNRGFRSFGHARDLDLGIQNLLPAADEGQQAGCLGDLNGDGALDMILALANGELWAFYRQVEHEFAMALTVAVPPDGPYAGPVNVAAWAGNPSRPLGTQVVVRGGPPALWGVPESEAGDVTVKWTVPGGTEQTKVVEVVPGDPPKRVFLDGLAGK